METLKLEHISPYLPYGLKAKGTDDTIYHVLGAYDEMGVGKGKNLMPLYNDEYGRVLIDYTERFGYDFKPLLRPMDLTKPIENGIIPAIEIAKFMDNGHNHSDSEVRIYSGVIIVGTGKCDDVHDVRISFSNKTIYSVKMDGENAMFETTRRINQWLAKHKFDFMGLIEKGLAIDVNTLETNHYQ